LSGTSLFSGLITSSDYLLLNPSISLKLSICVLISNFQVHAALDIVDKMCEVGMTLSIEVLHSILHASEESYDFNLVGCLHIAPPYYMMIFVVLSSQYADISNMNLEL
jgi:hypothetical protein